MFHSTSVDHEEKMSTKELVFSLILLMQACGQFLAEEPTAAPTPEPPGILQRLADRARGVKETVQSIGGTVMDFAGTYYEDHIQPVADSYAEWASGIKTSVVEKIQTTIDNYSKQTIPADQQPQS